LKGDGGRDCREEQEDEEKGDDEKGGRAVRVRGEVSETTEEHRESSQRTLCPCRPSLNLITSPSKHRVQGSGRAWEESLSNPALI
jgi:hypothetical protein